MIYIIKVFEVYIDSIYYYFKKPNTIISGNITLFNWVIIFIYFFYFSLFMNISFNDFKNISLSCFILIVFLQTIRL